MDKINNRPSLNLLRNTQLALLCLISFSLPFSILMVNLLTALLIISSILYYTYHRPKSKKRNSLLRFFPIAVMIIFFTLFVLYIEYYMSLDFPDLKRYLEKKLGFIFFPLILVLDPKIAEGKVQKVILFFILGNLFLILLSISYGILSSFFDISTSIANWDNNNIKYNITDSLISEAFLYKRLLEIFFIPPFYFSLYLSFSSLILVHQISKEENRKRIFLQSICLSIFITYLVLLSVRGIIIPFVFVLLSVTIVKLIYSKYKFKIIIIVTGLVLLASSIYVITKNPLLYDRYYRQIYFTIANYNSGEFNSIKIRINLYRCASAIIAENPLFGNEKRIIDKKLQNCLEQNIPKAYKSSLNVHNQFLHYILEIGVIGILLLMIPFVLPYFILRKNLRYVNIFIIMLIIGFLSESMMARFNGYTFTFFFYVVFISDWLSKGDKLLKTTDKGGNKSQFIQ